MSAHRLAAALCLVFALVVTSASAHPERKTFFPDHRLGKVPTYRKTGGTERVVCKADSRKRIKTIFRGKAVRGNSKSARAARILHRKNLKLLKKCSFEHIQAAVNAAKSGDRILILPGLYKEEPSRAVPLADPKCKDHYTTAEGPEVGSFGDLLNRTDPGYVPARAPTYEYDFYCPNSLNLVVINGDSPDDPDRICDQKCNLQIEGTGLKPTDVHVTSEGKKLNVFKADRADGIYFRNLFAERSDFNNFYVLETNGFVFDKSVAGYAREYGFLSFASDNGLYQDLEAFGAGDSGIYPGSGPEGHCSRYGIEIRRVDSHHNALGSSGTAGNGTWIHDSKFHHNAIGMVVDSFAPGHPGQPQDCAKFTDNEVYSNNENLFEDERDAYCKKPVEERDPSKVCPTFPVPVGTGIMIAGGNGNIVADNHIYDNWRRGVMLLHVPATFRGENDLDKLYDTSFNNRITGNKMGLAPDGRVLMNGQEFWWDEEGAGNCWQDNVVPDGKLMMAQPAALPGCPTGSMFSVGNLVQFAQQATCSTWNPANNTDPPGCDWFTTPRKPER